MMRIVVLDGFTLDQGDASQWEPLHAMGDVTVHARTRPDQLVSRIEGAEILITNKVVLDSGSMLPCLRYIGVTATGVNIVDLAAARSKSIAVTNVPGYSTASVAQHVFALLFHLTLDVAGHSDAVKTGAWAASSDFCFVRQTLTEFHGKTMALLGGGAIGTAVAAIAKALGMRVLFAQVPGSASTSPREPLHLALAQADVVSLHCPLTDDTRKMVNASFIAKMKPGAILVNTSRGLLLDENALLEALTLGRLGGVALDVLSQEPPAAQHPLLDPSAPWSRKLVVTPHIGWATVEARARCAQVVIHNLVEFLAGRISNRVA